MLQLLLLLVSVLMQPLAVVEAAGLGFITLVRLVVYRLIVALLQPRVAIMGATSVVRVMAPALGSLAIGQSWPVVIIVFVAIIDPDHSVMPMKGAEEEVK